MAPEGSVDLIVGRIFPAVLALLATPIMSGMVTAYNIGLGADFLERWLEAWSVALPVGLVVVYGVSPVARRATEAAVRRACRTFDDAPVGSSPE